MKKYLITGLLVWVPLGITIWVLNLTIATMDQTLVLLPAEWRPDNLLPVHVPGLGIILTFAVVFITGLLIRNVFGQRLWAYSEKAMLHVPFVGSIYKGVKQVSENRFMTQYILNGSVSRVFFDDGQVKQGGVGLPQEIGERRRHFHQ